MKKNLVTVCITTYNRKERLLLTLKSILAQSYKYLEIIIVDDFSNDGTKSFVEKKLLKLDKRIKYIRHNLNKGLSAARNSAIFNSRGKYFTFCDDDDLWTINFIEEFVTIASKYDHDWLFCCGSKYKNFLGINIETTLDYEGGLKNFVKEGYTPPVASQFYNLSSLKKIRGYNEDIKSGVDHDLWIRLAKIDINIRYIPKVLSIPNVNSNDMRMTTNYKKRINGIKNSLLLWKNDLINMYGNEFYLNFCNAYIHREQSKLLSINLNNLNIKNLSSIKKNISLVTFFKNMLILLTKKILQIIIPTIFIINKKSLTIQPSLKIKKILK